jgi:hypothetical protein
MESGEPQSAFPYSVIEPVTLPLKPTLKSSDTAIAFLAAAPSVPHLPRIPLVWHKAGAARTQKPNTIAKLGKERTVRSFPNFVNGGNIFRTLMYILPLI